MKSSNCTPTPADWVIFSTASPSAPVPWFLCVRVYVCVLYERELGECSLGAVVLCARAGPRARAKLMYLHTYPLSGPGLNRWFLFFMADL